MKAIVILSFITTFLISCNHQMSPEQLLEKTINYHDPNNQWNRFNSTFHVTMKTPNNSNRESDIFINKIDNTFYLKAIRDSIAIEYTITESACSSALNGSNEFSKEDAIKYNLNCERANMYKNYYTYLYGLPMKLKDLGARLSDSVERKFFQGKTYLVLRISYDESVGSDNWYVYINPETYAMEIYQFFKTDVDGNEIETSGEYILLSGETVINGIKMPKNRAWFYNKDDLYLGTDILK